MGAASTPVLQAYDRILGSYTQGIDGPVVIFVAGMHGNEPAGVHALQRVLHSLETTTQAFRGNIYALAGNIAALTAGERFLSEDMNRLWQTGLIERLRRTPEERISNNEKRELKALVHALEQIFRRYQGREIIIMDLHTTSSTSKPFAILGDTLRNRKLAMRLPVPIILGLEEAIEGTLMEYLTDRGFISLAFEAGRHDDPFSVDIHEAAIWKILASAGCLGSGFRAHLKKARELLVEVARDVPGFLEVRYRHAIKDDDHFEMEPGFKNFQTVQPGQVLAHDQGGEILADTIGHVLMPLYQGLGDDGFFLARAVHPRWLQISKVLRWLRLDKIVHWLPGVSQHPEKPLTQIVNPRIARWLVIEIFHLLGYRKHRTENGQHIVSKRKWDMTAPWD